jgi:hypothetical protein
VRSDFVVDPLHEDLTGLIAAKTRIGVDFAIDVSDPGLGRSERR